MTHKATISTPEFHNMLSIQGIKWANGIGEKQVSSRLPSIEKIGQSKPNKED